MTSHNIQGEMNKLTGRLNTLSEDIDLSDGSSIHGYDFNLMGGRVLSDGTAVHPVLQRFVNYDYYATPVEMCSPQVLMSDDFSVAGS